MKVLHIINNLNCGGAENLLLKICSGVKQANKNIDFKVLILEENYQLLKEFESENIPVVFVPINTVSNWKRPFLVAKEIKKFKPDIVHTHLLWADKIGQIAAWIAGVKMRYCTVHSCETYNNISDFTTRKITGYLATKIITVSDWVKQYGIKNHFYPASKIEVIYNAPGFVAKNVRIKENYHNPLRLLNVGRLTEAKGQVFLLRIISDLKKEKFPVILKIVGDGEERRTLEKEIEKLNISDVVILAGRTNNVEKELLWADILISTSIWEGFGMALIEAASVGTPVIATDIPSHREVLGDDYIGLAELNSIKKTIIEFSHKNIGEISKSLIERARLFSYDTMVKNYLNIY